MTKYSLTERQKDMLRSIVPGLEERRLGNIWTTGMHIGRIGLVIRHDDGGRLYELQLPEIWQHSQTSDFDEFVYNGFFNRIERNSFELNAQKIIDAVKSNFGEDEQSTSTSTSVGLTFNPIFGVPAVASQYKADIFVMMPFKSEMKHVYDDSMKPAAKSLNLTIYRGDDFFTKHTIMTDIWSAIYHARLIIADCTGKNANVFYELGMAHTVGKPVIPIAQNEIDIPFDLQGHRRIIYTDTSDGLLTLADELELKIPKLLET